MALLALPAMHAGPVHAASPFVPQVRDTLLRGVLGSASRYVMVPLQDVFGWDVRINTPATVNDGNWTWRVPVPVDQWRRVARVGRASRVAGGMVTRCGGRPPNVTGPVPVTILGAAETATGQGRARYLKLRKRTSPVPAA